MIAIKLADGSIRNFDQPLTGLQIAKSISSRLAKEATVIKIDGQLHDLSNTITSDCDIQILTRHDDESLKILRHDAAHVLAEAIKELYPETQISIGPAIENGFYYDIYRPESLTLDDLTKIEERMREIVDRNEIIAREEMSREQAIAFFRSIGENLKVEIIEGIPGDQPLSFYRHGQFIDLCRGPHLPSTGRLGKSFKLMKLAGAYWRGDSNNIMLQRIYGTAWATDQQLQNHLAMLEEAEKRDHRRVGRELELFHIQEESPGGIFWHPKGWTIYRLLQEYIRGRLNQVGYQEINTPVLMDKSLWVASGHWDKFRQNMFMTEELENRHMAMKPMNCPCHVQVFKQGLKSYRDLPLRLAEFGSCHRYEPSGALHGLMRVRGFVQDDAHIFCTEDQIASETKLFCELIRAVYDDFGFSDVKVKFATRPDIRAGSDDIWDKAEQSLMKATTEAGLEYTITPGEGAFYGPKLEFHLRDTIGREWQCGTLQADFVVPERLGATYIGEDGAKHTPIMLHRALLGSIERFIGILIEHYNGRFPFWLTPVQVAVVPITNDFDDYAAQVVDALKLQDLRVHLDKRNEKINYKIRELSLSRIPVILVVGKREAAEQTVTVRRLGSDQQEVLALQDIIDTLVNDAKMPYKQ